MAGVFLAHDEMLDRAVAIKQLHHELGDHPEVKARFLREARLIARLRHPSIVEIHDVVPLEDSGGVVMVMEYIDGTDLSHLLRKMPVPCPELAALVLRPIADALAHVHREGVIHRDIKPANVLLGRNGVVKLTDFGIARGDDDSGLTRTGDFLGTPAYIPPEQARGVRVTAAADQYSLGVLLYQLVTGEKPFHARSTAEIVLAILRGDYPDPRTRAAAVDDNLAAVIRRAMAHEPGDRYPDIDAFIAALDACLPPPDAEETAAAVAALVTAPEVSTSEFARLRADEWEQRAEQARQRGDFAAAEHAERAAAARRGGVVAGDGMGGMGAIGGGSGGSDADLANDQTLVDGRGPLGDDTVPSHLHGGAPADIDPRAIDPRAIDPRAIDPRAGTAPPASIDAPAYASPAYASPAYASPSYAPAPRPPVTLTTAPTVATPAPLSARRHANRDGQLPPARTIAGWKALLIAFILLTLISGGITWFLLRAPPTPPAMDRAPPGS